MLSLFLKVNIVSHPPTPKVLNNPFSLKIDLCPLVLETQVFVDRLCMLKPLGRPSFQLKWGTPSPVFRIRTVRSLTQYQIVPDMDPPINTIHQHNDLLYTEEGSPGNF